jgi:hypothetical protein
MGGQVTKRCGGKNEGNLHYVTENKWRQNIRNQAFHYVFEKQVSYSYPSIMLTKRNGVI